MAEWVYPLGTAADGDWQVSLGAHDSSTAVGGWAHTGLKVAELAPGASVTLGAAAEERIVVPLEGAFAVTVDGEKYQLRGRASVFAGPSDVLYSGIGREVEISSPDGGRVAVALAPARAEYPTRLVRAELRGAGNCSRQVHNFGTPAALEADRFIVCEVITPAGNWSSYPPHKHDEEKDGETSLEEIYYFETRLAPGSPVGGVGAAAGQDPIGYARVYASDERPIDVQAEVRSGDVVLVPYGWHGPAMAAPGYDLYYLNVMAGPGRVREWLISDDPHHGWVRQTWDAQQIDPRLPFTA
jgi:5-deoxy-glucuronate isomerase